MHRPFAEVVAAAAAAGGGGNERRRHPTEAAAAAACVAVLWLPMGSSEEGRAVTLFEAAVFLHSVATRANGVAGLLSTLATEVAPRLGWARIAVANDTVTVSVTHPDGGGASSAIHVPTDDGVAALLGVEAVGHALFGGGNTPAYERWRMPIASQDAVDAADPVLHAIDPLIVQPHGARDAWCATLFGFLECYRAVMGPVGLYWLLPVLYACAVPPDAWSLVSWELRPPAGEPPAPASAPASERVLCTAATNRCEPRIYEASPADKARHGALLAYLMRHQCVEVDRIRGTRGGERILGLYPRDRTLVLTVAGLPLATACVHCVAHLRVFLVTAICSATRTGGGWTLMRHVQEAARAVDGCVLLFPTAAEFYERLGFVDADFDADAGGSESVLSGYVVWPPDRAEEINAERSLHGVELCDVEYDLSAAIEHARDSD